MPKLIRAYHACRKNKRKTINALKFEISAEENLLRLSRLLQNRQYRPGRSVCFIVTHPKNREIFAADFTDRVVHHLLIGEIEKYFESDFIYDSFACRKGKGTHVAMRRLYKSASKITRNQSRPAFFAQLDVASFFTSIDKNVLFSLIERKLRRLPKHQRWKEEVIYLVRVIIFHNPVDNYYKKGDKNLFSTVPPQKSLFGTLEGKGLPIGNLTSQFFANVYLNSLDQFAKRKLSIKHYFRYVDDLVLLASDLQKLEMWRDEIAKFLEDELYLKLHPDKQLFGSVYSGIDFVGYFIKPNYILSRKRVVSELKRKLFLAKQGLNENPTLEELTKITMIVNSYYGHFRNINCYNLRRGIYEKHFGLLQQYLQPQDDLRFFRPLLPS